MHRKKLNKKGHYASRNIIGSFWRYTLQRKAIYTGWLKGQNKSKLQEKKILYEKKSGEKQQQKNIWIINLSSSALWEKNKFATITSKISNKQIDNHIVIVYQEKWWCNMSLKKQNN